MSERLTFRSVLVCATTLLLLLAFATQAGLACTFVCAAAPVESTHACCAHTASAGLSLKQIPCSHASADQQEMSAARLADPAAAGMTALALLPAISVPREPDHRGSIGTLSTAHSPPLRPVAQNLSLRI